MDANGRAMAPQPETRSLTWGDGIERPYCEGCRAEIVRSEARHAARGEGKERLRYLRLTCRECGQEGPAEGNFRTNAQSRTGFVSMCNECTTRRAVRARAEIHEWECSICRRVLPTAVNFEPQNFSRIGYAHVCNDCCRLPDRERHRLLREQHSDTSDELRRLWERQRHEIARGLLGGYYQSVPAYPAGQKVYALVDPRSDNIYYVGRSNNPERRLRDHLQGGGQKTNTDMDAWIAELRDAEMLPRLITLEDVQDPQMVLEREARWILEQLRRGEPLTNWQAYFEYLAEATRGVTFDLLSEPLNSERWSPLLDAWRLDISARQ